jgi:protein-S-isoprenylcysteine O-methyltransferase Ste14
MNKIVFTIVAIILLNIVPLLGMPSLILHYKTMILVIAAAALWLSQPAFSTQEAQQDKRNDKFSIILILLMSSLSVVAAVTQWAYGNKGQQLSVIATAAGAVLLVLGVGVRIWAIQTLGKHFTATVKINDDHQLVQTGPYAFVRHPSYLGAFMAIVGTPLFLNAWYATAIAALAMSIAYYVRIGVEEVTLQNYFGEKYVAYRSHTKRIIPFIW